MAQPLWNALLKGLLEGLTEFLPISSTGHLILVDQFLPLTASSDPEEIARLNQLFNIVVQFPAVLAILLLYRRLLWEQVREAPFRAEARRFWLGIVLACLPFAVLGLLFQRGINEVLMKPRPVALALLCGGVALLLADRRWGERTLTETRQLGWLRPAAIGLFQCLALCPGTSRSAATIIGGRALGLSRPLAAEYSFFLAIPTLGGAFVYSLSRAWWQQTLRWSDGGVLLVGSLAAFLSAWIVAAWFIRYLQRHSLAAFGWYRILLGGSVLALLQMGWLKG